MCDISYGQQIGIMTTMPPCLPLWQNNNLTRKQIWGKAGKWIGFSLKHKLPGLKIAWEE